MLSHLIAEVPSCHRGPVPEARTCGRHNTTMLCVCSNDAPCGGRCAHLSNYAYCIKSKCINRSEGPPHEGRGLVLRAHKTHKMNQQIKKKNGGQQITDIHIYIYIYMKYASLFEERANRHNSDMRFARDPDGASHGSCWGPAQNFPIMLFI